MSEPFENPYSPPSTPAELLPTAPESSAQLAGRFTRFAAALVDGFLVMGIMLPIQLITGYLERAGTESLGMLEQIAMSLLGVIVMLALNGYLLYTRGQTIGKLLTKIQIVHVENNQLLPFMRVYVYRYLWTLPFFLLVMLIPGAVDDALVNILVLIDCLLIFTATRRCLHDRIAGSRVVLYRPDRQPAMAADQLPTA